MQVDPGSPRVWQPRTEALVQPAPTRICMEEGSAARALGHTAAGNPDLGHCKTRLPGGGGQAQEEKPLSRAQGTFSVSRLHLMMKMLA